MLFSKTMIKWACAVWSRIMFFAPLVLSGILPFQLGGVCSKMYRWVSSLIIWNGKQHTQHLPVSQWSRPQHWNRLVMSCKRRSIRFRPWQHFCSPVSRSVSSFWYNRPPDLPLLYRFCFWYSAECTQMVSVISFRHIIVQFSHYLVLAKLRVLNWNASVLFADVSLKIADATNALAVAFILSHLDYCSSRLAGLPGHKLTTRTE